MSSHVIIPLVAVFSISFFIFFVFRNVGKGLLGVSRFTQQRNLWLVFTAAGFLISNFWLFLLVTVSGIYMVWQKEPEKVTLFAFLLLVLPIVYVEVPGLGFFNRLFFLSFPLLLSLIILLPCVAWQRQARPLPAVKSDWWLLAYVVLTIALNFRETSFTDSLRGGFVTFMTIYVPYLAFSRAVVTTKSLHYVAAAFVLPLLVLSAIGFFECVNLWYLYEVIREAWGFRPSHLEEVQIRVGFARAVTTSHHPITFGFAIMFGLGCLLCLPRDSLTTLQTMSCFALLCVGLISSLSRGPWVGALLLLIVYNSTRPSPLKRITVGVALVCVGLLALDLVFPTEFIDRLPFIGKTEQENVFYRQRLISNALIIINENILLGQPAEVYLRHPKMQEMIQGQGIIDIVNTYVGIALRSGVTGLLLFCAFFMSIILNLWKTYNALPDEETDLKKTGGALLATLTAILITIGTTSPIGHVQFITYAAAGLCIAYTRIAQGVLVSHQTEKAAEKVKAP